MNKIIKDALLIAAAGIAAAFFVSQTLDNSQSRSSSLVFDNDVAEVSFDLVEHFRQIPVFDDYNKFDWSRDFDVTDEDLLCLQQNIYFESSGEPQAGQKKVAWVTLNRVESQSFPDSICGVVWQPYQFSWTRGRARNVIPVFRNSIDRHAWKAAGELARKVVADYRAGYPDASKGADHFHSTSIRPPAWTRSFTNVGQTGNHVFFRSQ